MRKIILDLNKEPELLNKVAKEWAEAISKTKKTQVRNYYDKVLELEEELKEKGFKDVYPFIKMLNSKVAYGVSRKVVDNNFQKMIEECLSQIPYDEKVGREKFNTFKYFFEAVLGFFKGGN
ncbi:type III-A CRISPR-associated protein Csm2 [Caminibacter pacificus]